MTKPTTIDYATQTSADLLALLVSEEDRVTAAHIRELVARPDAIESLRLRLTDRNRWEAEGNGEWWSLHHAFTILCLSGQIEVLDDALKGLKLAYEYEFDWLFEVSIAGLAKFGAPAIERLISFVNEERGQQIEFHDTTYWRSRVVSALTRIALENPDEQKRIAEFVTSRFSDDDELDSEFLAFITDSALLLDREASLISLRIAYDRDRVNESIAGSYDKLIASFDKRGHIDNQFFYDDLLEFYRPDDIARRQVRWRNEADAEARRHQKPLAQIIRELDAPSAYDAYKPAAPEGYQESEDGFIVRATRKIGRNDPCPCLSGNKYKKCCGAG